MKYLKNQLTAKDYEQMLGRVYRNPASHLYRVGNRQLTAEELAVERMKYKLSILREFNKKEFEDFLNPYPTNYKESLWITFSNSIWYWIVLGIILGFFFAVWISYFIS